MAYPTTTEHHKLYPYTSIMASPYECDPTGALDIASAIEQLKANQSNVGTIYFPHGTWKLSTALTIPSGMSVVFEAGATINVNANLTVNGRLVFIQGGLFNIATGVTVTINGPLGVGISQIFSCTGTGKVVFGVGSVKEVYHQWWGGKTDGVTDSSVAVKAAGDAAFEAGVPLVFAGGGSVLIDTQCKWGNTAAQTGAFIHIRWLGDSKIISTSINIDGIFCFEGPHPTIDGAGNRHSGRVLLENPRFSGAGGTSKALKWYGIQGTTVRSGYITGFGTASWSLNHDIADFLETYFVLNVNGIVSDDSTSTINATGLANTWNIIGIKCWNNTGDGVNIFGGNGINIKNSNFVANERDIVIADHATLQGVATKLVVDSNYHESASAGGCFLQLSGSLGGGGLVRAATVTNNNWMPDAAQDACVKYVKGLVDANTEFRGNWNQLPLNAPDFMTAGAGADVQIYETDTEYSATSTIVGFASYTTKEIWYHRVGKRVFFRYYLLGVSNDTVVSFTLPYDNGTSVPDVIFSARVQDNGTWPTTSGMSKILTGSNLVEVFTAWDDTPTAFTNSGNKAAIGSGFYDVY